MVAKVTEVILTQNVANLGNTGEIKTVRRGYYRNYLGPRHFAVLATRENVAEFESRRQEIDRIESNRHDRIRELCLSLEEREILFVREAGQSGRLFGSVTVRDIAKTLSEFGVDVGLGQILLKRKIKDVGEYEVGIAPKYNERLNLNVIVISSLDDIQQKDLGRIVMADESDALNTVKKLIDDRIREIQNTLGDFGDSCVADEFNGLSVRINDLSVRITDIVKHNKLRSETAKTDYDSLNEKLDSNHESLNEKIDSNHELLKKKVEVILEHLENKI
ncbi:MAG: 50S ribosomal protein L9 [gamma proteobacterium symbiont of Ctena orbiculata]|nr:MAG: 50S ribosomal protein L9 [gamma proteobacterium symbiont of Ctena orbiculata]